MTPNCNMQTLTSNKLIFKVLLLQQTKGKTVTRTQKPMLKIHAKKMSQTLERDASQENKQ